MPNIPENLRYTASHEWVSEEDGVYTALLHKAHSIVDRVFRTGVVGSKRHVSDKISIGCTTTDCLAMNVRSLPPKNPQRTFAGSSISP